ncbi:class I SAM-dependent methyltransferase [Actinocorallia longicatena]|uniref:Methyltransferase type 11 domain-containing protein n=1 Tax=Actinocorallia longicatena TaxID=111803 RepID=A0ABP6Q1W1_9ACTN
MVNRPAPGESPAEQLANYLQFIEDRRDAHTKTKASDGALRRYAKHLVPQGFRGRARFVVTDVARPAAAAKAKRITAEHAAAGKDLLLHIGSGGEHKDGWINIDLAGDPVEVPWNLKRSLPFPDASAAALFSEHLLEHIPLHGVVNVLRDCHRVLKPGGIMRVGVPDAGRMLRSYTEDGKDFIATTRPDRPQLMLAVQELFYWYDHCTMYDEEMLKWLLNATGFTGEIHRREPGETDLPVAAPDTPKRWDETLYVETVRP